MTTDTERTQLLAAAQRIQSEQQAREAGLRAFMTARLGVGAGTVQADAIIACNDAKDLSQEQLHLLVQYDLGLPADYSFSDDQLTMVLTGQPS